MIIVSKIEDAAINAIKNAPLPYALRSVGSYGGEFDDEQFDVLRGLPAVWIAFGGTQRPTRKSADKWRYDATFSTIVCARSVRSEAAARKGSATEPGAYQIMGHIEKIMLRQDFGLPIDFFRPGAIRPLFNAKTRSDALAAYAMEWHTAWIARIPLDSAEWLTTGVNYYLQPDDGNADASDEITMKEETP